MLPKLFESYDRIGTLLPEIAEDLGFPSSCIVAAGAGDNAAAAVGTGTVGTEAMVLRNVTFHLEPVGRYF